MSNKSGVSINKIEGQGVVVGVVQARFNSDVTDALWVSCCNELLSHGVENKDITHVSVPGALELSVVLQRMAQNSEFDVLIAIGAVIKGDTYHFDLVCAESTRGISKISLDYEIPIINMVLTTYNEHQAFERIEKKGTEAARSAIEMANLMTSLDDLLLDGSEDYDV